MNDETLTLIQAVDRRRGHPFFPPEEEWGALPELYATENVLTANKLVVLHYFVAAADWWIVEVNHDDRIGFGFACLGDPDMAEWGYVDLKELATLFRPGQVVRRGDTQVIDPGIIVERDLYWSVRPASEVEGIKIPGGA